jgi:ABC-2 type transport system ATP-binding protein
MSAIVVTVRDLVKRFGDFAAVDGVSLQVEAGEIYGFLGPNGAGKSTTIRMMCGLLRPTSGTAVIAGADVARDPDGVKRRIGYMSQKFSLYGDLPVDANLELFGALYGLAGERFRARRSWAIETMELGSRLQSRVADLPGGFRQRLALACALLHEPQVVFLDEPTGGVDPLMRRSFFRLIDELAVSGVTVFVTTHFLDEAEYCHRVALIAAGKKLAEGTPTELKQLVADRPLLDVRSDEPGRALEALAGLAELEEASVFGAGLHVTGKAGRAAADVGRAVQQKLAAAGVGAGEVTAIPPTLEDVFLRLTREARR